MRVLQIEAMAQTGGVFSLSKVKTHLYSTYFMKIDNLNLRKVIQEILLFLI